MYQLNRLVDAELIHIFFLLKRNWWILNPYLRMTPDIIGIWMRRLDKVFQLGFSEGYQLSEEKDVFSFSLLHKWRNWFKQINNSNNAMSQKFRQKCLYEICGSLLMLFYACKPLLVYPCLLELWSSLCQICMYYESKKIISNNLLIKKKMNIKLILKCLSQLSNNYQFCSLGDVEVSQILRRWIELVKELMELSVSIFYCSI